MTQVIDFIGGEYRNRTGVHGFAIRCVTTPPTRRRVGVIYTKLSGRASALAGCQGASCRGARTVQKDTRRFRTNEFPLWPTIPPAER